jgi:type I restriction enzyme S subunit
MRQLDEVCYLIGGGTPSKSRADFYGGHIPWATVRDMHSDVITGTEFSISADAVRNSATNVIPSGNVVIATRVGLGKVCTLEADTAINQDLRGIVPKHPEEISTRYLFWWFRSITNTMIDAGTGATVQGVKNSFVSSLRLPLPPLPEQQRIVRIVDESFEGIATAKANAEKNLQNARAVFDASLDRAVPQLCGRFSAVHLASVCHAKRPITYGVIKLGDEVSDGVPCLRTSNVRRLRIDTHGIKRISRGLSEEYGRTILEGGEIVVNVRGTLGGVAVIPATMKGWNVSREVAVASIDGSKVNPAYAAYVVASGASQSWLNSRKKGAAYVGINIEDLRLLPVPLAPLAEQARFVAALDETRLESDRLVALYTRKLAALDALKKSLLHQAFSGAL